MFIGHFGLGFAAKRVAPRVSLGTAFLAAQFVDLLWPTLLLLGLESVRIVPGATAATPLIFDHYPISHSLAAVIGWGLALGAVYALSTRNTRGAFVVAALVVSHWMLDAIVHVPDLPLMPGVDTMVGLGLWQSKAATLAVEIPIFAAGVWLYVRSTRAKDKVGSYGLTDRLFNHTRPSIAPWVSPRSAGRPSICCPAWRVHHQRALFRRSVSGARGTPHAGLPRSASESPV